MKTLITAALMALTATAATADTVVIRNNPGGMINRFVERYDAAMSAGDTVELRGDFCSSSCTLWLAYPDVCVDPATVFQFHGPSNGILSVLSAQFTVIPLHHFMSQKRRIEVVNAMADHYRSNGNTELGDWFINSGAWKKYGAFFTDLTAAEVNAKFDIAFCEAEAVTASFETGVR